MAEYSNAGFLQMFASLNNELIFFYFPKIQFIYRSSFPDFLHSIRSKNILFDIYYRKEHGGRQVKV